MPITQVDAGNTLSQALNMTPSGGMTALKKGAGSFLSLAGGLSKSSDPYDWYKFSVKGSGYLFFVGKSDEKISSSITDSTGKSITSITSNSWDPKDISTAARITSAGDYYFKLQYPAEGVTPGSNISEGVAYNLNYAFVSDAYLKSGGNLWADWDKQVLSKLSNNTTDFSLLGKSTTATGVALSTTNQQLISSNQFISNEYNTWNSPVAQALRNDFYKIDVESARTINLTFSDLSKNGWDSTTNKSSWAWYNLTVYKLNLDPSEDKNGDGVISDDEQHYNPQWVTNRGFSYDQTNGTTNSTQGTASFDFKLGKGSYIFEISSDGANVNYLDSASNQWVNNTDAANYSLSGKVTSTGLNENALSDLGTLTVGEVYETTFEAQQASAVDGSLLANGTKTFTFKAGVNGAFLIRGSTDESVTVKLFSDDGSEIKSETASVSNYWQQPDKFNGAYLVEEGKTYTISLSSVKETDFSLNYLLTDSRILDSVGNIWSSSYLADLKSGTTDLGTLINSKGKVISSSDKSVVMSESSFFNSLTKSSGSYYFQQDAASTDGYRFTLQKAATVSFTVKADGAYSFYANLSLFSYKNVNSQDTNGNGVIDENEQQISRSQITSTGASLSSDGKSWIYSKSLAAGTYNFEISSNSSSSLTEKEVFDGQEISGRTVTVANPYQISLTASQLTAKLPTKLGALALSDGGDSITVSALQQGLLQKGVKTDIEFKISEKSTFALIGITSSKLGIQLLDSTGKDISSTADISSQDDSFGIAASTLTVGQTYYVRLTSSSADSVVSYKSAALDAKLLASGKSGWYNNLQDLKNNAVQVGTLNPDTGVTVSLEGKTGSSYELANLDNNNNSTIYQVKDNIKLNAIDRDDYLFNLSNNTKLVGNFSFLSENSYASITLSKVKVSSSRDLNLDRKITDNEKNIQLDILNYWNPNSYSNDSNIKKITLGSGDYDLAVTGGGGYGSVNGKLLLNKYIVELQAFKAVDGGDDGSTLEGSAAADYLDGKGGNDTLNAGAGNDMLNGGAGNDVLNGGSGVDLADYSDISSTVTANIDFTKNTNSVSDSGGTDTLTSIEGILTGSGNDNLTILSTTSQGANVSSGSGSDTVTTGVGNDIVDAGTGNNTVNGGSGVDTISYDSNNKGINASLVTGTASSNDSNYNITTNDTITNFENILGSNFDDILTGNSASNVLNGGFGDDVISGGGGADTLIGGMGADTLTGGSGADIFKFDDAGKKLDTLSDFSFTESDKIDLSLIDANTSTTGNQAFAIASTSSLGSTATKYSLWYKVSNQDIIISGDVNGDTTADFQIKLVGVNNLSTYTVKDFIIDA